MLRLSASVCIDAPPEQVWADLARLEAIELWSEPVLSARCAPGRDRGVGAVRVCRLRGGLELIERWVSWDEGRSFTYEGTGIPLVASARNTWTVLSIGTQTMLTSEATVTVKGGRMGRLLEPLLGWQSRRLGRHALAAFKHLVETGSAPTVSHRRLAHPLPVC